MGLDNLETCNVCGATYRIGKPHKCEPFSDTVEPEKSLHKPSQDLSKGLKYDEGKLQYSLIPTETTKALAEVLTFGASKYGPNNWQLVDDGKKRYMDALFRHIEAYRAGEEIDPESGMSHLAHALTNVAFLHYLETKESNE